MSNPTSSVDSVPLAAVDHYLAFMAVRGDHAAQLETMIEAAQRQVLCWEESCTDSRRHDVYAAIRYVRIADAWRQAQIAYRAAREALGEVQALVAEDCTVANKKGG